MNYTVYVPRALAQIYPTLGLPACARQACWDALDLASDELDRWATSVPPVERSRVSLSLSGAIHQKVVRFASERGIEPREAVECLGQAVVNHHRETHREDKPQESDQSARLRERLRRISTPEQVRELRPGQLALIESGLQHIDNGLLAALEGGTGIGKSGVAAVLAAYMHAQGRHVVVAAPSLDVLSNLARGFAEATTGVPVLLRLGRRQFVLRERLTEILDDLDEVARPLIQAWIDEGGRWPSSESHRDNRWRSIGADMSWLLEDILDLVGDQWLGHITVDRLSPAEYKNSTDPGVVACKRYADRVTVAGAASGNRAVVLTTHTTLAMTTLPGREQLLGDWDGLILTEAHLFPADEGKHLRRMWELRSPAGALLSATLYTDLKSGLSHGYVTSHLLGIPEMGCGSALPQIIPQLYWTPTVLMPDTADESADLIPPSSDADCETDAACRAYYDRIAVILASIAQTARGGVLVLNTSYSAIRELASRLRMSGLGDRVIEQQRGVPFAIAKDEFMRRGDERVIWLATGNAWTGLDVVDHSRVAAEDHLLTDVVIPRLPISSDQDKSVLIPSATYLKMKQGIGRLMRREGVTDRRLWLLDARLVSSDRRHVFLTNPVRRLLTRYPTHVPLMKYLAEL